MNRRRSSRNSVIVHATGWKICLEYKCVCKEPESIQTVTTMTECQFLSQNLDLAIAMTPDCGDHYSHISAMLQMFSNPRPCDFVEVRDSTQTAYLLPVRDGLGSRQGRRLLRHRCPTAAATPAPAWRYHPPLGIHYGL